MTPHNFKVRFYLGAKQVGQDHRMIHVRIHLDGKRDYLTTTGIAVEAGQWKEKTEQVGGGTTAAHLMNQRIGNLRQSIESIYREQEHDEALSLATIKQAWHERQTLQDKSPGMTTFFRQYLEENREAIGKDTHRRMEQTANIFAQYLEDNYPGLNPGFGDIDHSMLHGFESYLSTREGYTQARTIKNKMSMMKNLMGAARELGMTGLDPFEGYTAQSQLPAKSAHLTIDELRRLRRATLTTPRLDRVRDCFLFSCHTGLGYREVRTLTREHIVERNGSTWIRIGEGNARHIPLSSYTSALIAKYATAERGSPLLPMISHQKVNRYLKEIAKEAGINKPMTYQLAVRTFVQTALAAGASTDTISHMTGKSVPQSHRQGSISTDRIAKDMYKMATHIGLDHE